MLSIKNIEVFQGFFLVEISMHENDRYVDNVEKSFENRFKYHLNEIAYATDL